MSFSHFNCAEQSAQWAFNELRIYANAGPGRQYYNATTVIKSILLLILESSFMFADLKLNFPLDNKLAFVIGSAGV